VKIFIETDFNMPYLPSATMIFASTSPTSQAVFTEFLPFVYFALGFIIGALLITAVIKWVGGAFHSLVYGPDPSWHGHSSSQWAERNRFTGKRRVWDTTDW